MLFVYRRIVKYTPMLHMCLFSMVYREYNSSFLIARVVRNFYWLISYNYIHIFHRVLKVYSLCSINTFCLAADSLAAMSVTSGPSMIHSACAQNPTLTETRLMIDVWSSRRLYTFKCDRSPTCSCGHRLRPTHEAVSWLSAAINSMDYIGENTLAGL